MKKTYLNLIIKIKVTVTTFLYAKNINLSKEHMDRVLLIFHFSDYDVAENKKHVIHI